MPERAFANRRVAVAATVVLLHLGALWALQAGLLRRVAEVIVPAAVISEIVTPPQPQVDTPTPVPVPPAPVPVVTRRAPPPPAPQPVAIADPTPAAQAATGVVEPQPPAPPVAAPVAPPSAAPVAAAAPSASPAPPAPPAPPRVELPSSDAAYLNNPEPPYPALSRRLGEQGRVVVRVLISAEGVPLRAEIARSSQYDRLDRMAVETAMRWRYVPGRRGGVPEAMWFDVPMNFVLE